MPSTSEILQELSQVEKESYKDVITLAKKLATTRRLQYLKVQEFMQARQHRLNAINTAVEEDDDREDIINKYAIFQEIMRDTSGQGSEELNDINGVINGSVYGDVKKNMLRKRQLKDMNKKLAFIGTIISDLADVKSDLEELESQL